MLGYAKYALIGIASAIFLFFTTRTLRRREQEPIDHAPTLAARARAADPALRATARKPARPTEALRRHRAGVAAGAGNPVRRQVEQLAESSPEKRRPAAA